ncbi:MAG: cytochrome C oxidase subunit IV family protein [Chromatiales bacterium]|nr:cytochrome C oxidase subunit IV family protein [Chromatiales bacterium]
MRPCTIVWLVLIALTLSTLAVGKFELIDVMGGRPLVAFLLITTFIKGVMISDYFMGLKFVRRRWRIIPLIYLIIVCSLIWIAYNQN